jgi:hypothetical protein
MLYLINLCVGVKFRILNISIVGSMVYSFEKYITKKIQCRDFKSFTINCIVTYSSIEITLPIKDIHDQPRP